MNKALFIVIALMLFSCSKVERTKKRIEGSWEIVSYQFIDQFGFTDDYETSGTITFGANSTPATYQEQYTYTDNGNPVEVSRTGTFVFNDDTGEFFTLTYSSGSNAPLESCRFILVTRDDIKMELPTPTGKHVYILKND